MHDKTAFAKRLGKLTAKQALLFEGIGGALGASKAPKGHRGEGLARGVTRGLGTSLGTGAGALAGIHAGNSWAGLPADPGAAAQTLADEGTQGRLLMALKILGSMAAGGTLGGLAGYGLSGAAIGKPSWEQDKEQEPA